MGSLALRPGGSLTILLDGFVNRLQDFQSPSFLLFKLRGFELLPRWDFHPLFMPAFAGRTLIGTPAWRARKRVPMSRDAADWESAPRRWLRSYSCAAPYFTVAALIGARPLKPLRAQSQARRARQS